MNEQLPAIRVAGRTRRKLLSIYVLFSWSVCLLVSPIADPALSHAQDQDAKEIYQDFRNKRPLLEDLRFTGPDIKGEIKAEDEGLRMTLPGEREQNWAVQVEPNFPLTGDFEMTGTYEFLAGARPAKGFGVGVNLVIADDGKRKKFAKICRVMRVQEGSVHLTEYWPPYELHSKKTEAKTGQLRLVRVGPSLRYLVSDGPGQAFREIWYQKNFGTEDLHYAGFGVTDSGEPGNPVDARLIDLRIRLGSINADKAFDPAVLLVPAPIPAPAPAPADVKPPEKTGGKTWLILVLLLGLGGTIVVAVAVGALLFIRSRRQTVETSSSKPTKSEAVATAIVVPCSKCGKKLKTKAALAGKKVKCPQCGTSNVVPEAEVEEADDASD